MAFEVCGLDVAVSRDQDGAVVLGSIRFPLLGPKEATEWIAEETRGRHRLPIAEQDGYVWIYLGAEEPPAGPPRLEILGEPRLMFEMRTIPVRADWRLMLERSLDFAQSAFVQTWMSPLWLMHKLTGGMILESRNRSTTDGLAVDGYVGKTMLFRHSFHLPDRSQLTILPQTSRPMSVLIHHVPLTPGRSRLEVVIGHRMQPWDPPNRPSTPIPFKAAALPLHNQDVWIVEALQRRWETDGPSEVGNSEADTYSLLLRNALAEATAGLAGRAVPSGA